MMLATPSTGASNRAPIAISSLKGTHVFEVKLDGVRAQLSYAEGTAILTNRNGVDVSQRYPEIIGAAQALGTTALVLDGEIVSDDGKFSTLAHRDRLTRPRIADVNTRPCRFIAFDLLRIGAVNATKQPWTSRRESLELLTHALMKANIHLTPYSDDPDFLEDVRRLGLEGVIAKRKTSQYRANTRSQDWIKFKCLHSVSCLVYGYERGSGHRSHFGAMLVALLGPDGPVPVGRVGTGFTDRDCAQLKELIDAKKSLVVEIQCLNVSRAGILRFPVYKGIRTDVAPRDCTIEQLDTIPLY